MDKVKWEECLKAWENVKNQATIDLEQSTFFIEHVKNKLKEFEDGNTSK